MVILTRLKKFSPELNFFLDIVLDLRCGIIYLIKFYFFDDYFNFMSKSVIMFVPV